MSKRILAALVAALSLTPVLARAQPPAPIQPTLFAFPGAYTQPPSATSAGLALADRWLGEQPFGNPALASRAMVVVSPALLRVSRQDLRAGNRNYDEQGAFFDGAGAHAVLPLRWRGRHTISIYLHQPLLRLEDNAFNRGTISEPGPPGVFGTRGEMRELRAGLGVASPLGGVLLGAAVEYVRRADRYRTQEDSGSPESGSRDTEFDGDGIGAAVGARWGATVGAHPWSAGLALRLVPALELAGEERWDLLSGSGSAPIDARREGTWEAGASVRYRVGPAFDALLGIGGQGAQRWEGFGVEAREAFEWKLAGELHDDREPWSVRFGGGMEQRGGVPEPRAGVFGIGLGWDMDGTLLEVGAMRRSLERPGRPRSYDDRVVVSVRIGF